MLELHRAERADVLAGALCEQLRSGFGDPFEPEIIAVPSRGVERWLTQQLSLVLGARSGHADGVCANVIFPGPGRLMADVVAAASGIDPHTDPWRPGRSVWPLLELIGAEPALVGLVPRGDGGPERFSRYAAARRVAALFEAYATARPAMIRAWLAGADIDGQGEPLPADRRWQPRLWRRLRALLAVPSPVERLEPACTRLIAEPELAGLPPRLSLFGLTRLPPGQLEVLSALAVHREVQLWLPHPSAVLWDRIRDQDPAGPVRRAADPTAQLARQPLLASLGRDARELQLTLAGTGARDIHHLTPQPTASTALQELQLAVRADSGPPAAALRRELGGDDRSLQVHACHGRARQVEVLRDVILGLLSGDASLEPRDVLVMCPDIETFAPLISATFGAGPHAAPADGMLEVALSPAAQLRVRLADRSLRQVNPVMSVAASLLDLADGRMTASEVLDLAAAEPVRRRFGFDDDDLARLADWVDEAEVKWGLDPAHRGAFQLEQYQQNTWEAGVDRLLLGVAMAEYAAGGSASSQPGGPGWVGRALPLDDVDSTDIERVGLLAELVHRLRTARMRLAGPQPLAVWIEALAEVVESLTACPAAQAWQAAQLRGELAGVLDGAGARAESVELTLADLRQLLADRLQGRPTRANFGTGSLTMCTLVPMRSVPHRVVCLLGLDDGAFPRAAGIGGSAIDVDDLLRLAPLTGERDARSEDRQLFLDAICSARDHLVVIYSGADERTNARRPPAVPVGELLDAVDGLFVTAAGRPAREQVEVRHPLQPFDPANYAVSAGSRPFSFDPASLGGARAVLAPRRPPPPFLADPLSATPGADVELDTLRRFFESPARGFLRQRLEVTLPERAEEVSDELSVELDSLTRWGVGERLLRARLSGVDASHCRQAEWRRGTLPPGRLGTRALDDIAGDVEAIVSQAAAVRDSEPVAYDIGVELPGGRRLTGTVGGVYGRRLVTVDYGKINPKRRLRLWLPYLLLAAARPELDVTGLAIGRGSSCEVGPVASDEAHRWLADLLDLHAAGLREPLPIALDTSLAYAAARRRGVPLEESLRRARTCWSGGDYAESQQPEHVVVFGTGSHLDALTAMAPGPADRPAAWPDEPSRFGVLSRRWWDPLLEAESRAGQ